jgi:hypothetical protein
MNHMIVRPRQDLESGKRIQAVSRPCNLAMKSRRFPLLLLFLVSAILVSAQSGANDVRAREILKELIEINTKDPQRQQFATGGTRVESRILMAKPTTRCVRPEWSRFARPRR